MAQAQESAQLHFLLHQNFKIVNAPHRTEMIRWCGEKGVRLVIFDSLVRLHDLSEVNSDAMRIVNAAIKDFTLAGITVVILHHSNRRGGVRGSSEIGAGYDGIYKMEKVDDCTFHMINMINEKARSVGENGVWPGCTVAVSRDAATQRLVLDGSQALPMDDDDAAPSSATAKREKKQTDMRDGVLALLAEVDAMSESALAEKLGNSSRDKDTFKAMLAELEAGGEIVHAKRGKGRFYRWLTDAGELSAEDEE